MRLLPLLPLLLLQKGALSSSRPAVSPGGNILGYDMLTRTISVKVTRGGRGRSEPRQQQQQRRRCQSRTGVRVLVNTRLAADCTSDCAVRLPPSEANSSPSVAVYETCGGRATALLHSHDDGTLPAAASLPAAAHVTPATPLPRRPRILLYNTVEHTQFALSAAAWRRQAGHLIPTIEDIVRSNGSLSCTDHGDHGGGSCTRCAPTANNTACCLLSGCGVYHATPTLPNEQPNYYCWWRRRRNGTSASSGSPATVPEPVDCANISTNARYLAQLWHRSGVDVIVPDTTNGLYFDDPETDLLNIRPVEVLLEEFSQLRSQQRLPTPQMAIWTVAGRNTSMYRGMLPLLNRARINM